MSSVSVSELKARLSHYLRVVQRGGEVQVLDRGVPVARLVGLDTLGDDPRRRLVASGVLRPGAGGLEVALGWDLDGGGVDLSGALDEEREDRV